MAHMDTCVVFRSSAEHLGFCDKARHTPKHLPIPRNPSPLIQNLSSHWQCIEALQHQQLAKPSHKHEESSAHRPVRLHDFLVKIRDPNDPDQTNKQKTTGLLSAQVLCLVLLRALDKARILNISLSIPRLESFLVFSESKTALHKEDCKLKPNRLETNVHQISLRCLFSCPLPSKSNSKSRSESRLARPLAEVPKMDTENFLSSKASKPKSRCSLWTQDQHFDGTFEYHLERSKSQ